MTRNEFYFNLVWVLRVSHSRSKQRGEHTKGPDGGTWRRRSTLVLEQRLLTDPTDKYPSWGHLNSSFQRTHTGCTPPLSVPTSISLPVPQVPNSTLYFLFRSFSVNNRTWLSTKFLVLFRLKVGEKGVLIYFIFYLDTNWVLGFHTKNFTEVFRYPFIT